MKDAITQVITHHGTVQYGFKLGYAEWMQEIKVCQIGDPDLTAGRSGNFCISDPTQGLSFYHAAADAAEEFVRRVFRKANLALCFTGIRMHGLHGGRDFDDMSEDELKSLVTKYRNEFWAADYPFAADK